MAATTAPAFRALFADAHVLGAGRQFKSHFRLACSAAVRSGVYTGIRFERRDDGTVWYAAYRDDDGDGVRSNERHDTLLGPFPLSGGAPGVSVAINPGIPALPPEHGFLSEDPVRFGSSDILSFSPFGTATPGTFYVAGGGPSRIRAPVSGGRPPAQARLLGDRGVGQWALGEGAEDETRCGQRFCGPEQQFRGVRRSREGAGRGSGVARPAPLRVLARAESAAARPWRGRGRERSCRLASNLPQTNRCSASPSALGDRAESPPSA
jgi:hypothetical protein